MTLLLDRAERYSNPHNFQKMSSTTTAELAPTTTITLVNGQTCTFSSQPASTAETIPIIDVSRMFSDKIEDRKEVALEIREASRTVGFFNIINHVSRLLSLSRMNNRLTDIFFTVGCKYDIS